MSLWPPYRIFLSCSGYSSSPKIIFILVLKFSVSCSSVRRNVLLLLSTWCCPYIAGDLYNMLVKSFYFRWTHKMYYLMLKKVYLLSARQNHRGLKESSSDSSANVDLFRWRVLICRRIFQIFMAWVRNSIKLSYGGVCRKLSCSRYKLWRAFSFWFLTSFMMIASLTSYSIWLPTRHLFCSSISIVTTLGF